LILVPERVSRALLEHEAVGASAWADRTGWRLVVDLENLQVTADLQHPREGPMRLVGEFNDYKAIPPAWRFVDPETATETPASYPSPGPMKVGGSIFHSKPVICAPFNRLAFSTQGGPHSDWQGESAWLRVVGHVRATTLGEMLVVIDYHLATSPGRMG